MQKSVYLFKSHKIFICHGRSYNADHTASRSAQRSQAASSQASITVGDHVRSLDNARNFEVSYFCHTVLEKFDVVVGSSCVCCCSSGCCDFFISCTHQQEVVIIKIGEQLLVPKQSVSEEILNLSRSSLN
jgi:hypothetical protein